MLIISKDLQIVRVVRTSDSDEWLVCPWRSAHLHDVGVAGPNHFWAFSAQASELQIYCFDARSKIATVKTGYDYIQGRTTVKATKRGDQIYAVTTGANQRRGQSNILAIETCTGRILDDLKDHPLSPGSGESCWIYERSDGSIMFPIEGETPSARKTRVGFLSYHPSSQSHRALSVADHSNSGSLGCVSPSGKYALRWDCAAFPVKQIAATTQLGLTVQLWECDPVKFVRRLQVCWLPPQELRGSWWDAGKIPSAKRSERDWSVIAAALNLRDREPTDALQREDFPEPYRTDERAWMALQEMLSEYSGPPNFLWDADETGFWYFDILGYFGRVTIDGVCSPRTVLQRHAGANVDYGNDRSFIGPRHIRPLGGWQAQVDYRYGHRDRPPTKPWTFTTGHATVDVTPQSAESIRFVGPEEDSWVDAPPTGHLDEAAQRRVEVFEASLKKVAVKLKSMGEADCIGAIESLTAKVRRGIGKLVLNNEIRPLFLFKERELSEEEFFAFIETSIPGAVPALRGLIVEFTGQNLDRDKMKYPIEVFSDGGKGIGVFGPAVKALGVLDINSLELLQRYALCLDVEHESYFPLTIVPDVIRKHGWGDRRMVAFALWMMRYDFYNSINSYDTIWRDWGMAAAIRNVIPPPEMAQMVMETMNTYSPCEGQPYDGVDMLQRLRADLRPYGPYETKLFQELDALLTL